jgi:hypothetical protein
MAQTIFRALIFFVSGGLGIYRGYMYLMNPDFGRNYVKHSPKAYFWRAIFGEEKAERILRGFFAPLAILLGGLLILMGVYTIFNQM